MADFSVGVRLFAQTSGFIRSMRAGRAATQDLQRVMRDNRGARAAVGAANELQREFRQLSEQYRRSNGRNRRLNTQLADTAKRLRDARHAARGYGLALRDVGRAGRLAGDGGGVFGGTRGRLFGAAAGVLTVGAAKQGVDAVLRARASEEQALFRLGTVSGLQGGARARYLEEERARAEAVAQNTGLLTADILASQYAALSAGIPREAALDAAVLAGKVAVVTNGSAEAVTDQLAVAYNNFASELTGTSQQKLQQIGDLFTQAQLQFQIANFGQLGEGFRYAAATAKTYNISLDDTVGLLGQLNTLGLQGSQAGTAFTAFITRLTQDKTLEALGFELQKTADGQLDVVATLNELQVAYRNLQDEVGDDDATNQLAQLFGQEGLRGAALLMGALDDTRRNMDTLRDSADGVVSTNFDVWATQTTAAMNRVSTAWSNFKSSLFVETGFLSGLSDALNSSANFIRGGGFDGVDLRSPHARAANAVMRVIINGGITVNAGATDDPEVLAERFYDSISRTPAGDFYPGGAFGDDDIGIVGGY